MFCHRIIELEVSYLATIMLICMHVIVYFTGVSCLIPVIRILLWAHIYDIGKYRKMKGVA